MQMALREKGLVTKICLNIFFAGASDFRLIFRQEHGSARPTRKPGTRSRGKNRGSLRKNGRRVSANRDAVCHERHRLGHALAPPGSNLQPAGIGEVIGQEASSGGNH